MNDNELRRLAWSWATWGPTYWLIHKVTGLRSFHSGDDWDRDTHSLARVVDHDHCIRCHATFSADPHHLSEGYSNADEGWLCPTCHKALTAGQAGEG